jgi:heptosyltransferase I
MAKVCFVRTDRIGDLILTLPVEESWRSVRSGDEFRWLIYNNLKFVMNCADDLSPALYVSPVSGVWNEFKSAFKLKQFIKAENFNQAIFFHVRWWVAFAFWLARVPVRLGPASQWFSWLFFNKRLRQKRSEALKHESQYNLDLVGFALGVSADSLKLKPVKLTAISQPAPMRVIIHPGMAGSARNWPAHKYNKLAVKLIESGYEVAVTGSRTDRNFIDETGILKITGVIDFVEKTNGAEIIDVLNTAETVIVPSTGVAHLAASLGKHVIGIYSPVKVQAFTRWQPIGEKVDVMVPKVNCPGVKMCLGAKCTFFDCMEQIDVDSVVSCVIQNSGALKR